MPLKKNAKLVLDFCIINSAKNDAKFNINTICREQFSEVL